MVKNIKIKTEYITLGQLLKYVNIINSGAEAKAFLQENYIIVNGEKENRRGRKIYPGYVVEFDNIKYVIE